MQLIMDIWCSYAQIEWLTISMFSTHIQGQKEQLLNFTKLESTYRVLGLKAGLYGRAAAAKSLVFKAIVQRHIMQETKPGKSNMFWWIIPHPALSNRKQSRLIDHRPALQGEIRYFVWELDEGLVLLYNLLFWHLLLKWINKML